MYRTELPHSSPIHFLMKLMFNTIDNKPQKPISYFLNYIIKNPNIYKVVRKGCFLVNFVFKNIFRDEKI